MHKMYCMKFSNNLIRGTVQSSYYIMWSPLGEGLDRNQVKVQWQILLFSTVLTKVTQEYTLEWYRNFKIPLLILQCLWGMGCRVILCIRRYVCTVCCTAFSGQSVLCGNSQCSDQKKKNVGVVVAIIPRA